MRSQQLCTSSSYISLFPFKPGCLVKKWSAKRRRRETDMKIKVLHGPNGFSIVRKVEHWSLFAFTGYLLLFLCLYIFSTLQHSTLCPLQTPLLVCLFLFNLFLNFLKPWPFLSLLPLLSLHVPSQRHGVFSPGMNVPSGYSHCSSTLTPVTQLGPIRMKY